MSAIGGYLELELSRKKEYHETAIRLNTGRNALEYILLANNYKKIYLPYFTCEALLQPIIKNNIGYEFYHISKSLEPCFDFSVIKEQQAFLYTNYFGLKDGCTFNLSNSCKNLIIDNAQSFYSRPLKFVNTFYSARKFFGVTDGSYLFTDKKLSAPLKKDHSYQRFEHLLQRIDQSAEHGYQHFIENENSLNALPLMKMSNLTQRLLASVDYNDVAAKRRNNFRYLSKHLKDINKLHFDLDSDQVPMVYPFFSDNLDLRKRLIENKIYTSQYWKSVDDLVTQDSIEYKLTNHLVHLPIDQRYDEANLNKILKIIKDEY